MLLAKLLALRFLKNVRKIYNSSRCISNCRQVWDIKIINFCNTNQFLRLLVFQNNVPRKCSYNLTVLFYFGCNFVLCKKSQQILLGGFLIGIFKIFEIVNIQNSQNKTRKEHPKSFINAKIYWKRYQLDKLKSILENLCCTRNIQKAKEN